jgi:hypothetical protein
MKHLLKHKVCFWFTVLLLAHVSIASWAATKNSLPPPASRTPRNIQGWNVLLDDRLLTKPNDELGTRVLKLLEAKLVDITYVVPSEPLKKLQAVTIVLDLSHGPLHNMQ